MPEKVFLVCIKRTKWERDLKEYQSIKELKSIYRQQNYIFKKIYSSHVRQKKAFEKIYKHLQNYADFIYREDLHIPLVEKYPFFIIFGGDNHFIYNSRFANNQPIIGINSDPQTSTGALLYFITDSFINAFYKHYFEKKNYKIEEWSLIEGTIYYPDGSMIQTGPCISEAIVRNEFPDAMSRYLIRINNEKWEEQKSSGLLIATGAGSSGWFYNALPHSLQIFENPVFPKNANYFKSIAREPGFNRIPTFRYLYNTIYEKETLEVISEMDGVLVIDSHKECVFPFPQAAKVIFRLSSKRLKVVQNTFKQE